MRRRQTRLVSCDSASKPEGWVERSVWTGLRNYRRAFPAWLAGRSPRSFHPPRSSAVAAPPLPRPAVVYRRLQRNSPITTIATTTQVAD